MKKIVNKTTLTTMIVLFMFIVITLFMPSLPAHAAIGNEFIVKVAVTPSGGGVSSDVDMIFKILTEPSGNTPGTVQVGVGTLGSPAIDKIITGELSIPSSVTNAATSNTYNVTAIGGYAFSNGDLTNITIPDGVTTIGGGAFHSCIYLTNITIPDGVTTIGLSAFEDCTRLTNITIPNSVTYIGGQAFQYCNDLVEITIPDGIQTIEQLTFNQCYLLHTVNLPSSVTTIGYLAFQNNTSLANIDLQHVETIEDLAFRCDDLSHSKNNVLTSIDLSSATSIGDNAFEHYVALESVTMGSVTSMGSNVFNGCTALTSADVAHGITTIGDSTFANWANLQTVAIPKTVTTIGANVFQNSNNLSSIYYDGAFGTGLNTVDIPHNASLTIYYNADASGWGAPLDIQNPADPTSAIQLTPIPIKVTPSATQFTYDGNPKTVNVAELTVGGVPTPVNQLTLSGNTATALGIYTYTVEGGIGGIPRFVYTNTFEIIAAPTPAPTPTVIDPNAISPQTGVYN